MRPSVGFATVKLLEDAGADVHIPARQTCCGQPAFNNGDLKAARRLAEAVFEDFDGFDDIVVPSGSCAGMMRKHMPDLFAQTDLEGTATNFSQRVFELTEWLDHRRVPHATKTTFQGTIAFHESCSAKRELGLGRGVQQRLAALNDVDIVPLSDSESCCGFGGTFSISFPEISNAMVSAKTRAIDGAHPTLLTGCELGCLLNIAGKLRRESSNVACRHIAEVFAGDFETPEIGASLTER